MDDDQPDYGPAMAALTEKQRAFVQAMIEFPGISHRKAALRAGYSNVKDGAKVRGFECGHNPGVQAAIREEAGKRLNASSLAAAGILVKLMQDKRVKSADRIKAAGMLLDRSGFGAAQTINVNKTTTDRTGKAIMERIAALAQKHGLDAGKLLGAPVDIKDAEFVEVKDGE